MEHHAPHPSSVFEGYYSKFDLPSGAKLAIIICEVKSAKKNPYMVSLTYVPKDVSKTYQKEIWAKEMHMVTYDKRTHAFGLEVPGIGYARWDANSTTEYDLKCPEFTFRGKTTSRTPWSAHTNTPEALLVNLPLPLHWHVQSLASDCDFEMSLPSYDLPPEDRSGKAIVHQEKNWAQSFPAAHMWLQARKGDRAFCCAGGKILGMEAFLLGYRSEDLNIDFRPPFAVRLAGLSPFLSYETKWEERKFELSVQNFFQKLTVTATAPKGTFFPLSAPFEEGHRPNFLNQSFQATFVVKIYKSGWFSPFKQVREDVFEGCSLEYGGGYYPPAGSEDRYH
ncbi:hypothetical protein LTR86_005628 [Recurvomyces mirabilis]|nr:hypothetical protein LTR86_005628 [Recurvomyces mirabilis]